MGNQQPKEATTAVDSATQLSRIAKMGDIHELAACLKQVNVNIKLEYGSRALHIAAEQGHSLMCKMLIRAGARLNLTDDSGMNALQCAAAAGHSHLVPLLADCGVGQCGQTVLLSNKDVWGRSALLKAVINRHTDTAERLLDAGADVNAQDMINRTPLHVAASYGDRRLAELFISNGADVDALDNNEQTPLYLAVVMRSKHMIQYLASKNCNLDIAAKNKLTPLMLACQRRYYECVRVLVELGARLDSHLSAGYTKLDSPYYYMLHGALSEELLDTCILLLRSSPRLELHFDYNMTAHVLRLLTPTHTQLLTVLELLLAMGAPVCPLMADDRDLFKIQKQCDIVRAVDDMNIHYQKPVTLRVLATRTVRAHCSPNVLAAVHRAVLPQRLKRIILMEDL